MTRQDKLHRRLEELEKEYRVLLAQELEREAKHEVSHYLIRKKVPNFLPGFWNTPDAQGADRLEGQIRGLHAKLGIPIEESAIQVAEEFCRRSNGLSDQIHGGESHLAKEMIERLGSAQQGGREVRG